MANRIRAITGLSASASVFNPSSLFYNAELGFIENLLGSSTLFQDSAGTTPAVLGSVIGRINSANGSGVYASQATTSKKPILKRMPTSGIRNLLSDSDNIFAGTDFNTGVVWSQTAVNALNAGGTSWRVTNDGVAGSRSLSKLIGASSGAQRVFNFIFEKSVAETAVSSTVSIYNSTKAIHAGRVQLNWITEAASILNGNGGVIKLSTSGPNGGVVFKVWCTAAVDSGDNIGIYFYPAGTSVNTDSVIVHRGQFESGSAPTADQITVGGYDVYEQGYNQVYWLDYDGADDELVLNNPDLGTNATRIRAQLGGPVIEQGLTLGANLTLNTDNLGLILLNRPLTADELAAITNYYTRMVA